MQRCFSWGLCCALAAAVPQAVLRPPSRRSVPPALGGCGELHYTNLTGPNMPGVVTRTATAADALSTAMLVTGRQPAGVLETYSV